MRFHWRIVFVLLIRAINASGCGSKPPVATATQTEAKLKNSDRNYMYWLPPNYDGSTPAPVIFSFHGAGGTAKQQAGTDKLATSDYNTDHIVVYLQSAQEQRLWEVSPEVHSDDVGYAMQVLEQVQDDLCIDDSRIYATGMSQGGGMVNLLACNETASLRFAAFAPVAGSFYFDEDKDGQCNPDNVSFDCSPGRDQIPILAFQGGADDVVVYKGGKRRGGCLPNVGHWISQWAVREGLGPDVTEEQKITSAATKYSYGDGNSKGLVSLLFGGSKVGHVWPATDNKGGGTASFDASSFIMDFFKSQQLPKGSKESRDDQSTIYRHSYNPTSAN